MGYKTQLCHSLFDLWTLELVTFRYKTHGPKVCKEYLALYDFIDTQRSFKISFNQEEKEKARF